MSTKVETKMIEELFVKMNENNILNNGEGAMFLWHKNSNDDVYDGHWKYYHHGLSNISIKDMPNIVSGILSDIRGDSGINKIIYVSKTVKYKILGTAMYLVYSYIC